MGSGKMLTKMLTKLLAKMLTNNLTKLLTKCEKWGGAPHHPLNTILCLILDTNRMGDILDTNRMARGYFSV